MGRSHGRKRILVVEDEPLVLNLVAQTMGMEGYLVLTAQNGQKALNLIRDIHVDFIICDVKMPDCDGEVFYDEVQKARPQLRGRIAFMTGDTVSPRTVSFLEKSGAPYLLKPFNLSDLRRVVAETLEKKSRTADR